MHYRTAEEVKAEFGARPRRALVITTVKYESRAVQAHLVDLERISGSNNAIYELGRFPDPAGDWAVVQAFCQAGNNDAAAVAMKAYADFGRFNVLMFVGVAGSLKDDVPIGSVVIGNFVYNLHSGKEEDAGFQSRPHGYPAANELIHAASALVRDDSWIDLIKSPKLATLPAVDKYPCPYPPEAVIKAIASGEQVVAGGKGPHYAMIRERLNDAAAVEMEGYGAMTTAFQENTSAVIVRGISDMCAGKDHSTDKAHQLIAAAHAAAFAFGMLSIRSKASPLSPGGADLPTSTTQTEERKPASDQRVEYVLNFKGSRSDWSDAKIETVIAGLRKMTGDPELTLLRVEEGSVRLVVNLREKDVPALTFDAIRSAMGETGSHLLGAISAQQVVEANEAKAALKRASADLLAWEQTLPGGGWLERPERTTIEGRFHSESSLTVLLGEPGSGKSALLAERAHRAFCENI